VIFSLYCYRLSHRGTAWPVTRHSRNSSLITHSLAILTVYRVELCVALCSALHTERRVGPSVCCTEAGEVGVPGDVVGSAHARGPHVMAGRTLQVQQRSPVPGCTANVFASRHDLVQRVRRQTKRTGSCNAQFTSPARRDKTVLSVSCLAWRCELDNTIQYNTIIPYKICKAPCCRGFRGAGEQDS